MPNIRSTTYALAALAAHFCNAKDWDSPAYNYLYQFEMPIAPIKEPMSTFKFPNGPDIDYYEIDIKPFETQIYPNLGKTRLVGYDGIAPGPTFMVKKGREAVVRFINHSDRTNSVHLHGSYSRAPFDGWADDTTDVGEYKDYYYPNAQNARTLWYHDHAIDHTAENAYMGQAGFYIMHDDEELAIEGLPQGKYDIPIALTSKRYNSDGSLWSPEANNEEKNLFGDVIHANGQPWPYFKVEPRKYRLRFLNAAISRSFELYFEPSAKTGTRANMKVVGSDAGLLLNPVDTDQLDISMAERWEVVFDFSKYKNQNVTLRSNAKVADVDPYIHTDKVMRFVVGDTVSDTSKNGELPAKLRDVPFPPNKEGLDQSFEFQRTNGQWKIDGVSWADGPEARVMAKPKRGSVERWKLKNGSGGWTHPIHIHLIDFQIVSRTGTRGVRPYEKVALKDVVWLNTNEEVNVIARFSPWDGLYMFHCHNLIHEDHEMMAALNVSALSDLGYDEKTRFIDPMESRYRAKAFAKDDFEGRGGDFSTSAIQEKVKFFNNLDAYRFAGETEEKLEAYWKTAGSGSGSPATSSSTSSSTVTTLATSTSSGASGTTTGSSASSSQGGTTTSPKPSSSSTKTTTTKSSSSSKKKDDDAGKTTTTSSAKSSSKTTTAKTTTTKR